MQPAFPDCIIVATFDRFIEHVCVIASKTRYLLLKPDTRSSHQIFCPTPLDGPVYLARDCLVASTMCSPMASAWNWRQLPVPIDDFAVSAINCAHRIIGS